MKKKLLFILAFLPLLFLIGCSENQAIVNDLDERDANEIVVFLTSKGIETQKIQGTSTENPAGGAPIVLWNIFVAPEKAVDAMSILNQNGLPRKKGATLLGLFPPGGLMTTDKEQNIRYQRGMEEELANIIRKIDGVIDAQVQISFPPTEETLPGTIKKPIKAAVYIKHQGILDDPNNHLETKIKRLLAGSIDGLDFENVSIVTDRARFADIQLRPQAESIYGKGKEKEYVSVWSIVMTKASLARFRFIFFICITAIVVFGSSLGWLIYKFYPHLRHKTPPDKKE